MDGPENTTRGWRGTPDVWLDAAYDLLVTTGIDSVKVLPLAARLGLSRTSFYWHFADREALLAALLDRWAEKNTANLLSRCAAPAATVAEAMLNIMDCWVRPDLFDSRLDFAIRNWAQADAAVAAKVGLADQARIAALDAVFRRFGFGADEADTRARTVYLTQVGYIAIKSQETIAERLRRIPAYVLTFGGQAPTPEDMLAFCRRNALQVTSGATEG